jgi:hypothetical protein
LPVIFIGLIPESAVRAALNGSLETRFQSDSFFDPGNYVEQWLTLNYHSRDSSLDWNVSGNYGASSTESWMNIHRMFLQQDFLSGKLNARLGRFERIDAAGFYSLDGVDICWKDGADKQWNVFIGKPGRSGVYAFPNMDEDVNKPDSDYLMGWNVSRSLSTESLSWISDAAYSLGLRYHFSGVNAWKLDVGFSGNWQPRTESPPVDIQTAVTLSTEEQFIESFDAQASMPVGDHSQLWLRGRRYDPPDDVVTFQDRYYRYFSSGWQTTLEAGYSRKIDTHFTLATSVRGIARELGVEGVGMDVSLDWRLKNATLLQGRLEWLDGEGEHTGGVFLGYQRPLNTRLLFEVNGALRDEYSHLDGSRTVVAGEVRLDWMWTRDLHLSGVLELAHSRGVREDYDQLRFGLHLRYELPARGAEDYR